MESVLGATGEGCSSLLDKNSFTAALCSFVQVYFCTVVKRMWIFNVAHNLPSGAKKDLLKLFLLHGHFIAQRQQSSTFKAAI